MSYTKLFQAILLQAVCDAIKSGDFRYFRMQNIDFVFICSHAGFLPQLVVKQMRENKDLMTFDELISKFRIKKGVDDMKESNDTDYIEHSLSEEIKF